MLPLPGVRASGSSVLLDRRTTAGTSFDSDGRLSSMLFVADRPLSLSRTARTGEFPGLTMRAAVGCCRLHRLVGLGASPRLGDSRSSTVSEQRLRYHNSLASSFVSMRVCSSSSKPFWATAGSGVGATVQVDLADVSSVEQLIFSGAVGSESTVTKSFMSSGTFWYDMSSYIRDGWVGHSQPPLLKIGSSMPSPEICRCRQRRKSVVTTFMIVSQRGE